MTFSIKDHIAKLTLADLGLSWIIFFSIVYQKLVPIGFGIMLLSLVFKRQKITKPDLISFFSKGPAIWFILYYFLLVIGLLWTENQSFAMSKLENKLSFILIPILLFYTVRKWNNLDWKQLLVYALIFALVMYEILALWRYISQTENSWQFEFLSSRFSVFMHRSYFACYLVIGIILLFERLKTAFSVSTIALLCFFSIGVLQTESKAGIVCLFLVFIVQFFSFLKSKQKKIVLLFTTSLLFLIGTLLFSDNPIKSRFETMFSAIGNIQTKNNKSIESNTARILMWNASIDVWKENLVFGTGTGDYDDELTAKNREYKNLGVAQERLNSHNQFLNSAVQLGLVGFFVLLMIFVSSYFFSEKKMWQVLILVVFLINFLVESFLETQSGIVLFCVILILFLSNQEHTKSKTISIQ
ncbi:MAG: O-antigen ligase family protein [Bacteroidetes bacterium]|nr:O-antigen ligase family protein [Bacteroidota bacterium]